MKTIVTRLFTGIAILFIVAIGASIGYGFHQKQGKSQIGTPSSDLPPVGSVLRVEGVFEDGTFVATYAGKRMYYKNPIAEGKGLKIILEANQPYEVTRTKSQLGTGAQVALIPIR